MRTCTTCGVAVDGDPCPACGQPVAADDGALLLPSGRLGALAAAALAIVVFAGVWAVFVWLAPQPTTAAATPSAAPSTTPFGPTPEPAVTSTPGQASDQVLESAASPAPDPAPTPSSTPAPDDVDWDDVGREVGRSVVQVRADRCGKRGRPGTGFLVAGDRLLTAAHLVADASSIRVARDGATRTARLIAADATADVALLELQRPLDGPSLSVVPALVDVDDEVAVVVRRRRDGPARSRTGRVQTLPGPPVATSAGRLDDVLTISQSTRGVPAGAPVVSGQGGLVGMALVDHVPERRADTTHVVSGETVADLVVTWAGQRPRRGRTCPTPTPTPEPTPSPSPVEQRSDVATPAPSPDPFAAEPTWIAVLELRRLGEADRTTMARRRDALDERLQLPRQGLQTRLLRAQDWPLPGSGSWVLYLGEWRSRDDAQAACLAVRDVVPGCTARPLTR